MRAPVVPRPQLGRAEAGRAAQPRVAGARIAVDRWPRTSRVLPWLIAAFLIMIYLIPFDQVQLALPLPIESTLDRIVLPGLAFVWLAVLLSRTRSGLRFVRSPVNRALLLFVLAVLLSVMLNYGEIVERGELGLAVKRTSVIIGYAAFFYIVSTVIRPNELRFFGRLLVGLGCLLALGLIYQQITRVDLFHEVTKTFLPLPPSRASTVAVAADYDDMGRKAVKGPAEHALVAATLLAVSLCFTCAGLLRSRTTLRRVGYCLAFVVIVAGGFATSRKSAAILPIVALTTFMVAYPRSIRAILGLVVVSAAVTLLVVPDGLDAVLAQLGPGTVGSDTSTQARLSDYSKVWPDIQSQFAFGRGFGTYDALRYVLLDNQWLHMLVETGVIGLLAYAGFALAIVWVALTARVRLGRDTSVEIAPIIAAAVTLAVANAFYDFLGFAHAGYMLFFIAAMAVVAASVPRPDPRVALHDAVRPRWRLGPGAGVGAEGSTDGENVRRPE